MDALPPARRRAIALAFLAAAALVAALLAAYWTRDRTFTLDEWQWLIIRHEWSAETFLEPDNGHLIAFPLLVYKSLAEAFGADSHVPFSLLILALQVLVAVLLYFNAALRVGPWLALIPAVLMLFLGAGWEVLLNGGAIVNQISLAAGLGMLLCLTRGDRKGDLGAAALLTLSLASHSIGPAFAVGAAVQLALRRERPRRLWVAFVPLAAYAVWWIWAQKYDQTSIAAYSVASLPSGIFDQLSAATASLTGLFRHTGVPDVQTAILLRLDRAVPLTFAVLALIAWRLLGGPRPSPRTWAVLAILATYLTLVAVGINEIRNVESSRYAYTASALLLLTLAELTDGLRLGRRWALAAAAVAAIALVPNVAQMRTAGNFFRAESEYNRADLAALELAREQVAASFVPDDGIETLLPHHDLVFDAGTFFKVTQEFGSPAFSEPELLAASETAREGADRLSSRALGLTLAEDEPLRLAGPAPPGPPLAAVAAFDGEARSAGACVVFTPASLGAPRLEFAAPAGFTAATGGGAPLEIALRRFADGFTVTLPEARGGAELAIPPDLSPVPWRASIATQSPLRVCPPAPG